MVPETKLSPEQHQKLSRIVYKESGIVLNEKKYTLLVARLAKRMRMTKISSVSDYISLMSNDKDEFTEFIDATTTNHTFFFRENKHCEYIIKTLDKTKPLKIWSAASSSGEEPFSLGLDLPLGLDAVSDLSLQFSDGRGQLDGSLPDADLQLVPGPSDVLLGSLAVGDVQSVDVDVVK